jgi:archaeosortase C (PEF-CTERM variant)
MRLDLGPLREWIERVAPDGTPRRKVLQILSVVLFVEGLSVLIMFSYAWIGLGVASLLIGFFLVLLLYRGSPTSESPSERQPLGIKLADSIVSLFGGRYVVMIVGIAVVVLVVVFNLLVSDNPGFGDIDTITLFFGVVLIAYPFAIGQFKVEETFALLFIGFVVAFLAVPQILSDLASRSGTSTASSWYVHNMLVAPFSGILNLLGIPSSSDGNLVTIEFKDGTVQTLAISTYCAGLYSFSIFLAAFFSFVLVFEKLKMTTSILTLLAGIAIAYLGNVFRMVVIGVIGYYEGLGALRWTHENVGWMIFLAWSAVFWWVVLRKTADASEPDVN